MFSCTSIMGWAKFCRHMRKPFTLVLYINEVDSLNFIRSLEQLELIVIVSLHTQNTIFFYMLFSSICLWIYKRLEKQILKVCLVIIGGMWFLFLVYTCYGERTYILINYSNNWYQSHLFLFFMIVKNLVLNCVIFICVENETCFNRVLFSWRLS